jgi:hypothetical protein
VVYFWATGEDAIYMLYAYTKSVAADLTRAQIRVLRSAVEEEFG